MNKQRTIRHLGLLALVVFGLHAPLQAQKTGDWQANAGFYSVMITKPGLRVGATYVIKDVTKPLGIGPWINLSRPLPQRWVVTPQLGVYWDPRSFTAWHLTVEGGKVVGDLPLGLSAQLRLGGGIYQAWLPEVYEVVGNEVTGGGLAQNTYGTTSATLGLGWERGRSGLWLNAHIMALFPYNGTLLPLVGSELTYQFTLNPSRS